MIPQKLQIKNFLSYGPTLQTIDFTDYSLICLSGKNGHGKSALLDAITWALWGQARKIAGATKADQGLLRLGQTQMIVVFDFSLAGKTYRIRREYMETFGKPINILEFGMVDNETDTFIPLTDKTIRTTQEKIEQTIRLDFESFSNSAFLRQGSSNEFSKKSPKDRKQILATILGLDQYEVIRKLALEKTKESHAKKNILSALQEKRMQELTTQELLDAEQRELDSRMNILIHQEAELVVQSKTYAQERIQRDTQQKEADNLAFQHQQFSSTVANHQQQIREQLAQWRTINKKRKDLLSIHHLEQEKNNTVTAIAQHQKLFQENLKHQQTLLHLTQHIRTIEQDHKDKHLKEQHAAQLELERLNAEHKNHLQQHANTQQLVQQYTQENNAIATLITQHQSQLSGIKHDEQKIIKDEAHLERRKAAYQHYVSLGNWINSELNSLHNKTKLVHEDDPSCPLCEQNLSAARKKFLKANFAKQESFLAHRLRRLKRIIPQLKEILINQHAAISTDKERAQQAAALTAKIADLITQQEKITQQSTQTITLLSQQEQELAVQKAVLAQKQEDSVRKNSQSHTLDDPELRQCIATKEDLEKQLHQHAYNEHAYKKDQEQLAMLELQLTNYESLQKDVAQQEMRKNNILKVCNALKEIKKELVLIQKKQSKIGDLATQLTLLHTKERNLEELYSQLKQAKEELLHKKGSIENQQKHLTKIKSEYDREEIVIKQLDIVIDDYQTIATATGKDGIQALLIEEAIPEIEQEANYLLSRLTNNQAQIFIESLRDLKKGGTKETLDIKISDQAGIRPYELFSGGEAFRIDFALRIAISKLLARRAGTALQTLIIDEGFGSQDEEGLGYIMDALYKIQDDFSKIIIVSHLPTMKDQFPVHFFIEKGVQGSVVNVIEQG